MSQIDSPPRWLKPAAILILIGTITLVALVLTLVMFGIADPKPLGTLSLDQTQRLEIETRADQRIYQPMADAVHCPCTIEITLRQIEGDSTGQYGLWWRGEGEVETVAAINGNSYYSVFDAPNTPLIEWRRFHWLLPAGETNKLRVDLDGDEAVLRLNDEVAGNFEWLEASPIEVGFYVEGEEIKVTVERVRIWSTKP